SMFLVYKKPKPAWRSISKNTFSMGAFLSERVTCGKLFACTCKRAIVRRIAVSFMTFWNWGESLLMSGTFSRTKKIIVLFFGPADWQTSFRINDRNGFIYWIAQKISAVPIAVG